MVFEMVRVGQNCEFCGSPALVDTVHSLYIPYWTFDARVHCPWFAEAGHYYDVPVTRIVKGRPTVRMERRIRWVPASGAVDTFFDDEAVPGTQGLRQDLVNRGARAFQVLVNGYTGTIAGEYPKSIWKILLLVLAAVHAALVIRRSATLDHPLTALITQN
jgi:hypothetical protein